MGEVIKFPFPGQNPETKPVAEQLPTLDLIKLRELRSFLEVVRQADPITRRQRRDDSVRSVDEYSEEDNQAIITEINNSTEEDWRKNVNRFQTLLKACFALGLIKQR